MSELQACLFVCGPTASGKSAFAIDLAKKLNAEIINLDSVQVYRGANIGSAKLSSRQMQGVPHHLLDVVNPNEAFDVAKYRELAIECAHDIQSRGRIVIFCGGSTLYLNAMLYGLADLPGSEDNLRRELEKYSSQELHAQLMQLDTDRAGELHINDRVRVIRALESCLLSGGPVSRRQQKHRFKKVLLPGIILVKLKPRDLLYQQINQRSSEMIQNGLLQEVRGLIGQYGSEGGLFRAIGYAQVCTGLQQGWPLEKIEQQISQYTRNFAKRQFMFWRNEPVKRGWRNINPQLGLQQVELGNERTGAIRSKLKSLEALVWSASEEQRCIDILAKRLSEMREIELCVFCMQEDLVKSEC